MELTLDYKNKTGNLASITLQWDAVAAGGYCSRDQKGALAHVEELKAIGVPAPSKIPIIFWFEPSRVITGDILYVVGDKTSGEVEFFFARDEKGEAFITVASDHTDRELEVSSIPKAKQVCSKVIAKECWKLEEIRNHWDDIVISSSIQSGLDSPEELYQKGPLGEIIEPEILEKIIKKDCPIQGARIAYFSGTHPLISGNTVYAKRFFMKMTDPVLNREISHSYKVVFLPEAK